MCLGELVEILGMERVAEARHVGSLAQFPLLLRCFITIILVI